MAVPAGTVRLATRAAVVGMGAGDGGTLVSALTDVTGFGLAGHALEMARGCGHAVRLDWRAVPLLAGAREAAAAGAVTGASARNWASYGHEIELPAAGEGGWDDVDRALLTDPQTNGGLLAACAEADVPAVLRLFHEAGFLAAARVGTVLHERADAHDGARKLRIGV